MPQTSNDKTADKQEKKSPLPVIVLILIVFGVTAAGALHFTGRLKPFEDRVRALMANPNRDILPPQPSPEPPPEPVEVARPEPVKAAVSNQPVVAQPKPEVKKADSELQASYRKKFKAPAIGTTIAFTLKGGSIQTGVLEHLDATSVKIKIGEAEITFTRAMLAPAGLAKCYENDYVNYMVAAQKRRVEQAMAMKESEEKLAAEYGKFLASKGRTPVGSKSVSNESLDSTDFKAWMEEHGETGMLKARQERIREYEAERAKEEQTNSVSVKSN